MQLKEITDYLDSYAPLYLQEDYDNAGLIVGDESMEIKKALICLDSTEAVIDEAIENNCQLVIAHHPIVFSGLKKITGETYIERVIIKAIKHNIAIYAAHTNMDNVLKGVNKKIAEQLDLKNCKILSPTSDIQIGAGLIGTLKKPMDEVTFLHNLKKSMQTDCIRHTQLLNKKISTIALCGGSGSFLLDVAIAKKADIFITGDFKYHQFFDAEQKIVIADIGHYESEQYTIMLFYEILTKKFPNFAVLLTKINTNPINYLI